MPQRDTVIHNFLARSVELADQVVYRWPGNGEWAEATGNEIRRLVQETAAGLLAMGIEPNDRVGIHENGAYVTVSSDGRADSPEKSDLGE